MGISEITMSRRSVTINDLVSIASTTTPFVNIPKENATILSCPFSQLHRDMFDMISIKIYTQSSMIHITYIGYQMNRFEHPIPSQVYK